MNEHKLNDLPTYTYTNAEIIALFWKLYVEIKHGDEEHERWLRDKIQEFITNNNL